MAEGSQATVHELLVLSAGFDRSRPTLVARMDEDLIVYEAFRAASSSPGSSQVNWKRLNHEIIVRDRRNRRKNQLLRKGQAEAASLNPGVAAAAAATLDLASITATRTKHTPMLRAFTNIAGFPGFCITGNLTYLVFLCPRSGLTAHPLWIDGALTSFTPLRNASITMTGFIYLNKKFDIRICALPVDDCNGRLQVIAIAHFF